MEETPDGAWRRSTKNDKYLLFLFFLTPATDTVKDIWQDCPGCRAFPHGGHSFKDKMLAIFSLPYDR